MLLLNLQYTIGNDSNLRFSAIVVSLNLLRCPRSISITVSNVMISIRITALLMEASRGHALVNKVVFRTDQQWGA